MNQTPDKHIAPGNFGVIRDSNKENIDFNKLFKTLKSVSPWIILTFALSLTVAYIYIRYTKEMFQSTSVLQLDEKREASLLGINTIDDGFINISKEIELIKSKLFISKVAEELGFDVEYYQYGDILFEERYKNAPFMVWAGRVNSHLYNKVLDVEILSHSQYRLSYSFGDRIFNKMYHFNDTIRTDEFELCISLEEPFSTEKDSEFFFVIHSRNALVEYIKDNLTVEPLDFNAKTITISFKDHNKYKARDILYAIDTLYIYYTKQQKNLATQQKISFLNEQLEQTEKKLNNLEKYFESFTISNKTIDLDANISQTIVLLNEIDSQQFSINQRLIAMEKVMDDLYERGEIMINPADGVLFSQEIHDDLKRYEEVYEACQVLLSSYNENTHAYKKKVSELQYLKERIISYLESTIANLKANLNRLKTQKKRLETEFVKLPSKQTEFTKTQRFYSLYEEFYLSLMKSKAEFELAQAGTVTDYFILSPASLPTTPLSPNKPIIYGIGVMAGLFISFFVIGFSYILDSKITGLNELEKLTDIPVLGTIPFFKWEKKYDTRLIVDKIPKSEISESFRNVRTNLEFLNSTSNKKIITITSTTSGEGKTFIAVNLGGIISYLENKVIILDLDMRKPKLQKVFYNAETERGVSTILINKHDVESCILKTKLPNLDYISSGPVPPNPSELILSKHFNEMLDKLKVMYDVIILDTPPVGLVTDGIRALQKASIPIYILRSDFSKKSYLVAINRIIKTQKLKNLSFILNATKETGKNIYGDAHHGKHGYYVENETKKTFDFISIFKKFAK